MRGFLFPAKIKNLGQILRKIHTSCSYYAWRCRHSFWHQGQEACHLVALCFFQCCPVKKALLCQRYVPHMRTVCLCGIRPDRKREWESVCTLAHSSRSLQLFSIFICSHLPHGGCPGFSENTSHAEAAWTEDSDLGSGWFWLRKCLWEVIQLLVKTGSRFLVLLQRSRDVTLHRDTLQQATAPELELLGLGKPRLLLSLTWPEGVLWAPGVPRTRHSGAGNLLLRRNSVLALGRRKVCAVARGGAIAMERRTSRREHRWNRHYRVSILVVHPHRNKQLKAQVKFPLAPVFIFWGLCTFHINPKCVAKRFSPSGLIS